MIHVTLNSLIRFYVVKLGPKKIRVNSISTVTIKKPENIKRSKIPAVTHVNYSARIQTVHRDTNPKYHSLISKFKEITGCPLLVNTSFNVRGEPIVCTPTDAFQCFMGTQQDALVIGNCFLFKENQKIEL